MIQLSAEIRVPNPVLSSNATRKFDIALEVLRSLSEYWFNAEIILRLFEDSSETLKQLLLIGKSSPEESRRGDLLDDPGFREPVEVPTWHDIIAETAMPTVHDSPYDSNSLNHLGWNYSYWENIGFPYLSSFDGVGLN